MTFQQTRLTLRAILIVSLVILGHLLFVTSMASHPLPLPDASLDYTITAMSPLIFLTLLWTAFTLLEAADSCVWNGGWGEGEQGDIVFGRTWVELGLNSVLLGSWAYFHEAGLELITTYAPLVGHGLSIPALYLAIVFSLLALNLHLVGSIVSHARSYGRKTICKTSFWNEKTGHWSGQIILGEMASSEEKGVLARQAVGIKHQSPRAGGADDGDSDAEDDVWARLGQEMGKGFVACL